MAVPDYAQAIHISFLATMNDRARAARLAQTSGQVQSVQVTPAVQTAQSAGQGDFLSTLLDVVNPLQHLPVVSTLYRAISGDKITPVAQVAGDTLYGGLIGFASSLANVAFKEITGKDIGDTVLALLDGKDASSSTAKPAPVGIATAAPGSILTAQTARPGAAASSPVTVTPAQATTLTPSLTDPAAFMAALQAKNVDPALATRALYAYQKSQGLNGAPASAQP